MSATDAVNWCPGRSLGCSPIDSVGRGYWMTTTGGDSHRPEALARLWQAMAVLDSTLRSNSTSAGSQSGPIAEFREAIRLADELLAQLEHHVRGPLTVVKGRAQMMRRRQLAAAQPDLRLISGLNEVDAAVDRIVAEFDRLLGPRHHETAHEAAPSEADPT